MHRAVSGPLGLLPRATTVFAVLTVTSLTPAHGQQPSSACKLLQLSEIESAVGGKASTKLTGERQSAPGMTLDECFVEIPEAGRQAVRRVGVHIVSDLPMDGGEALRVRNAGLSREPQWKGAGARFEQETVGSAICVIYGRPGVAGHSTCAIPRGKGFVEVDVTGSVQELVSMEKVRALVQKALSRL